MATTVATSLYTEFRREGKTYQFLLTPEATSPETGKVVPMALISRQVSAETPRRGWRNRDAVLASKGDTFGNIQPVPDPKVALPLAADRIEFLMTYFDGLKVGGWELYREPLAVEMTGEDVLAVEQHTTPKALIRRVVQARTEGGFDESFWNL